MSQNLWLLLPSSHKKGLYFISTQIIFFFFYYIFTLLAMCLYQLTLSSTASVFPTMHVKSPTGVSQSRQMEGRAALIRNKQPFLFHLTKIDLVHISPKINPNTTAWVVCQIATFSAVEQTLPLTALKDRL